MRDLGPQIDVSSIKEAHIIEGIVETNVGLPLLTLGFFRHLSHGPLGGLAV
jgi:hypothetical protein